MDSSIIGRLSRKDLCASRIKKLGGQSRTDASGWLVQQIPQQEGLAGSVLTKSILYGAAFPSGQELQAKDLVNGSRNRRFR
jgi:hypothetical protein